MNKGKNQRGGKVRERTQERERGGHQGSRELKKRKSILITQRKKNSRIVKWPTEKGGMIYKKRRRAKSLLTAEGTAFSMKKKSRRRKNNLSKKKRRPIERQGEEEQSMQKLCRGKVVKC